MTKEEAIKECCGNNCGKLFTKLTTDDFNAGADWQHQQDAARIKMLEDALKEIMHGDYKFHQEAGLIDGSFAKIARQALGRYDEYENNQKKDKK